MKKWKLSILSLSVVALLAACDTETMDDDMPEMEDQTEETQDAETPADETEQDETDQDESEPEETSDAPDTPDASSGILAMEFEVSLEDALQMFFDAFGEEINIDEIEFDEDDGYYYYDIEGWDGEYEYDMEIDAQTGDIYEQEMEMDSEEDDILDLENIITPEEAMQAAVEISDSDVIDEWELELEGGRTVYEIDFIQAPDVYVDAHTGETF